MNRKRIPRLICALLCFALLMTDAPREALRAAADIAEFGAEAETAAPEAEAPAGETEADEGAEAGPDEGEAIPEPDAPEEIPSEADPAAESPIQGPEIAGADESQEPEPSPQDELDALTSGWVGDLNALGLRGDYERALWLYDRVIANFQRGSEDDALRALLGLSGSPLGYAAALDALMKAADIECMIVDEGNSAWNIAKLDGAWAHIDAYADDEPERYCAHFALSDAAMAEDHRWTALLPACAGAAAASGGNLPEAGAIEAQADAGDAEAQARSAAAAIVPSVDSLVLGKGETARIGYTLLPEGAQEKVEFSAKPAGIVVGDQDGDIIARKTGKTTVSLTAESGARAEVKITVKKAPTKVSVTGDRKLLGVGETERLGCKLSSGSAGGVRFLLKSGGEFATLSDDGLLTAIAPGKIKVAAETYNGKKSKAVEIEIKPAPTHVEPALDELGIGLGDKWTPEWAIDAGSAGKFAFASSNPGVADVDPDSGEITAKALGTAEITASVCGVSGTLPVRVVPAVTALELGEAPVLGVKQTLQLEPLLMANGALFEGNVCALAYKSSKASVASVSDAGLITAKKAGKSKITVRAANGASASYTLVVRKAPSSVSIVAERRTLGAGETLRLGYNLKPSSSAGAASFSIPEAQRGIATVSEDGLLEAIAPGKCTVTAITQNKKKKSLEFEVLPAPTSIELVDVPSSVGLNATGQILAEVNEGSAGALFYRALDPETGEESDAVEIDESGKVTGKKLGEALIEITTYVPDVRASAKLKVVPSPEQIQLPESIDLGLDDTCKIEPVALPEGCAASYSYSSSKKSCAAVSEDGLVLGKKIGSAIITVTANNGVTARVSVNIKKKPGSVSLQPEKLTLGVGESAQLAAEIPGNSATTLRYESSDEAVASVAPDGSVAALAPGEAVLSVATHNNKRAECKLSVAPAPTAIQFEEVYRISLGQQNFAPSYALEPEDAHTTLRYELISGTGVKIEDNRILAEAAGGEAVVRACTHVEGVSGEFKLTVVPQPEAITLPSNFVVELNGPGARLVPGFEPEESAGDVTFKIASSAKKANSYFTIDAATGWITPIKATPEGIEVIATAPNGASASTLVWVTENMSQPLVLEYLGESPVSILHYESYTPEIRVFPEDADARIQWTTSDSSIAIIDPERDDGTVIAAPKRHADDPWPSGRVTITGTSVANPKLEIKYKVIVLSEDRCLVMPEHRTKDSSTIEETERAILRVRESAYAELTELAAMGWISESERAKRQKYVDRAFAMYDFSWSPDEKKGYWKAANSEGGEKDFKPDTIYFGMPYTQNSRVNWPQKLIDNDYVVPESNYYRTTSKFKSRSYPGSDCSSFCSMAVWGYNDSRNSDTTTIIAASGSYKTLGSKYWTDLRPGDLICSGGHHVVMFLYYTNNARDQFVVIEQGGGGDDLYSNCVSTSIRDASYYKNHGYSIRRPGSLATNYVADR